MKLPSGIRRFGSAALLTAMVVTCVLFSSSQVSGQGRGRGRGASPAGPSSAGAQPAPQTGGPGSRGARWMDRNGDGKIDPSEVPDFMRGRFEATLREAGLDPTHGITVERYEELSRQRFAQSGGFGAIGGGPGRDERGQPQPASGGQATTETRLVPGFGNEFEETPVASFGESRDDESWQHDYDASVIAMARDIIGRYDTNKNGVLERSEWKAGQWRSDPNLSDRNKDGKLDLREMVERLVAQNKEAEHERARTGGQVSLAIGGGNPAGGGPGGRRPGGGAGGGADTFWRSLDKNNNSRLDREELAGNVWAQQGVRQAGFDPEKGVGLQELLDARARSGAGGGGRFRMGSAAGGPGAGFGFGGGMGFGNPTAGFGGGDLGDAAGMDPGDGSGSGDSASEGRKTGARGNRAASGASKSSAKKADGATTPGYRFQTSQELLPKDLPAWFLSKDKNGDGQVSMAEFSSTWSESEVARFKQYDTNNDGIITAAEVLATSGRATSREEPSASETATSEDRAESGSDRDVAAATETRSESKTESKPAPTDAAAPTAGGVSQSMIDSARRYLAKWDKNKNGTLEVDEWAPETSILPTAPMDANGDEKVTEDEIIAYFQKKYGGK